jgi:hypothetical protein
VFRSIARGLLAAAIAYGLASCAHKPNPHLIRISVPDQKMLVFENGVEIARYDVSTSKFGVGDRPGSFATPLGRMEVREKIGAGQPSGMKFKSRRPTGEIVKPNTPGRDPIVSRILWLRGLESKNRLAQGRGIYIHGTAEEWSIGRPASYGCIRMRSRDVIHLFDSVGVGTQVEVVNSHFPAVVTQGSGELATAEHFDMRNKPPGTPAPGSRSGPYAMAPMPMAAAAPVPAKGQSSKNHPNVSIPPTPIPAPLTAQADPPAHPPAKKAKVKKHSGTSASAGAPPAVVTAHHPGPGFRPHLRGEKAFQHFRRRGCHFCSSPRRSLGHPQPHQGKHGQKTRRQPAFPQSRPHSHPRHTRGPRAIASVRGPSTSHFPRESSATQSHSQPRLRNWMLDVGCWVLDVRPDLHSRRTSPSTPTVPPPQCL